ncbi:MAG: class I SAM-dependent methyltransferase, partial [Desulfurococcales archaeon]|nr:class I SAM-dependent methyltransferase [Desulfurococcales archaeon]
GLLGKGAVIRERYEATCMGYDELYGEEQFEKYAAAVPRVPPRGRILDAGCGTGLLAAYLAGEGLLGGVEEYVCLDYSGCMLSLAAARLRGLLPGRSLVVMGNVEAMPFPDGYFDVVYSFTVLDLVDDLEAALVELVRVSRGPVVFSMLKKLPYKDRLLGRYPILGVTSKDVIFQAGGGLE